MTMMSDLSPELVDEILFSTPLTSLQAVRSTSKQWNASSNQRVVCKARAKDEFLVFIKTGSRVCSMRFHGKLDDLSIKQVAKLNQFKIDQIFHCDGVLLCVSLDSNKLVIWNPYLNQTRIIEPTNPFSAIHYGIGYDSCGRYKILRFRDWFRNIEDSIVKRDVQYEIYDFDSNSWRGLDVNPDWEIDYDGRGVSVKGRSYWIAENRYMKEEWDEEEEIEELHVRFLLCFDYTRERFGPHLELPVKEYVEVTGRLSCLREEQLAVLLYEPNPYMMMEIWVTTKIEFDNVSWSKLLVFDMTPCPCIHKWSFVIDENKKVAMFFGLGLPTGTSRTTPGCNKVYIIGEDGYYNEVDLEVDLERSPCHPIVCSYVPSLVQIEQTARDKRKRETEII